MGVRSGGGKEVGWLRVETILDLELGVEVGDAMGRNWGFD